MLARRWGGEIFGADFGGARPAPLMTLSLVTISLLLVAHYTAGIHALGVHDLLRRLFHLPVILAAIGAGFRGGVIGAGFASLGYLPHLAQLRQVDDRWMDHVLELLLLIVVGAVVGGFADSARRARLHAEKRGRLAGFAEAGLALMAQACGPLSSIRNQTESVGFMAARRNDRAILFACDVIGREAGRLDRLIQDLRRFAWPGGASESLIDLKSLVAGVTEELEAGPPPGGPVTFRTDLEATFTRAHGRTVSTGLRMLLAGLLDAAPEARSLRIWLRGTNSGPLLVVRLHPIRPGFPALERDLVAVFGPAAGDYRLHQALGVQLLAQTGARVDTIDTSPPEFTVRVRFPGGNRRPLGDPGLRWPKGWWHRRTERRQENDETLESAGVGLHGGRARAGRMRVRTWG